MKRATEIESLYEYGIHPQSKCITLTGEVNEDMQFKLSVGLRFFHGVDSVRVVLSTKGGDVYAGFGMYDAVRAFSGEVTIKIEGSAMSMGAIILQAADIRLVSPHSRLMLHVGDDGFEGHAHTFQKAAAESKQVEEVMFQVLRDRTQGRITEKGLRKLLAHDSYLSASDAVVYGLADAVEGD